MRIRMPEIIEDRDTTTIRSLFEYRGRKEWLWYSVSSEYGHFLTGEKCDAFVVALLLLAMKEREHIHVNGVMSEKLHYNLISQYMKILSTIIPSLHRINIIPQETDSSVLNKEMGIVSGFSGGIDSFCLLADHFYDPVSNGFKITHLLFNNVGSHGRRESGRCLFEERYKRLYLATQEMRLPFIKVDSNLDDLLPFNFQLTHTMRNISVALILQNLIRRFFYASTYKYDDCFVGKTYDMAYVDPMAIHLLSTETTECIATGSQYSRVEKTIRVTDIPLSRKYLDVCVNPRASGNCSTCWKCARTLLTLEILGKLHLYDKVFDLTKYHQIRRAYIGKVVFSRDPLLREIRQLAQQRRHRISFMSYGYHIKNVMVSKARIALKKSVRRCVPKSIHGWLERNIRVRS